MCAVCSCTSSVLTCDTRRTVLRVACGVSLWECQCVLGAVVPQVCSCVLHTFLADGVVVLSLAAASTRGPPPSLRE